MNRFLFFLLVALPTFASAAEPSSNGIPGLLGIVQGLLNMLVPLGVSLALLFFIWGIAVFILSAGDAKKKEEGKNKMIWGIIAIFVTVSIAGLGIFVARSLSIKTDADPNIPQFSGQGGDADDAGDDDGEGDADDSSWWQWWRYDGGINDAEFPE